jgi:hypothetical protein
MSASDARPDPADCAAFALAASLAVVLALPACTLPAEALPPALSALPLLELCCTVWDLNLLATTSAFDSVGRKLLPQIQLELVREKAWHALMHVVAALRTR